jgi:hypothetical protein
MPLFPHQSTRQSDQSSSGGNNDGYDEALKVNDGSDGGVSLAEEEKRAMHVKIMMVRTALLLKSKLSYAPNRMTLVQTFETESRSPTLPERHECL